MFNVIVCSVSESCHDVIYYFSSLWVRALKKLPDIHVKEIFMDELIEPDVELLDMVKSKNCAMLCYNNAGNKLSLNDENIWEKYDVDIYSFLLDHPRNYYRALLNPVKTLHVICLDMNHVDFIHRFYPDVKDVIYLPDSNEQECNELQDFSKREIDVLYLGNCQQALTKVPFIDFLPERGEKLYEYALNSIYDDPNLTAEEAVERYIIDAKLNLGDDVLFDLLINKHVSRYIEDVVRREYKLMIMHTLDMAGIKVDIYGGYWEDDENPFTDNIRIHSRVKCKDCYKLTSNAKINLSIMPWFKKGSSEKPFAGMLNGAVCVSDTSTYLEETYIDGVDIMLFDLNHIEKAANDIKWLLDHPEEANIIAKTGYYHAKDYDSTDARICQIVEIMKNNISYPH